jgi:hypothetical protein
LQLTPSVTEFKAVERVKGKHQRAVSVRRVRETMEGGRLSDKFVSFAGAKKWIRMTSFP